MNNKEISEKLKEISQYLEIKEVNFKPRAYEKAARAIESFGEEIVDTYEKGGVNSLKKIPGVGVSIAETIEEIIKTGKSKYYQQLKKEIPVDISELNKIEGVGPKTIFTLYKTLGIKNTEELKKAAEKGKLRKIEGFGEKTEQNILQSIEFLKKSKGRFILGFFTPEIEKIAEKIKNQKGVKKATVAGSARRKKETIGDIDILAIAENTKPVMDFFVNMPEVVRVYGKGKTKSSVRIKDGIDIDLRVVPEESYGAALLYFTGSKEHNVKLREEAISKGYTLNEYGLFKGTSKKPGKKAAGKTEEEIYKKLNLQFIPPEIREAKGEIKAAKEYKIPKLLEYKSLKGDLQIQTEWSDGANSIEEMARYAIKEGLEYILITDHTKSLAMAHGLDSKRIKKQWKEIDKINKKLQKEGLNFKILKGTECDILKDGTMDLPDKILKECDIVGGAIHSYFNLSQKDQTERIKKAMRNPHVDIIFHPTGRVLKRRQAYEIDINDIIKTAKETNTILEINAYPDRRDLKNEYIKKGVEAGIKFSISSDAHQKKHISYLENGIAEARRGWAKKENVINTKSLDLMLKEIKGNK
jgi:DNA polymerase (family X)